MELTFALPALMELMELLNVVPVILLNSDIWMTLEVMGTETVYVIPITWIQVPKYVLNVTMLVKIVVLVILLTVHVYY